MWGGGYNVSREVLLAIRQGNQHRVEHLVEGLLVALRAQRHGSGKNTGVDGVASKCIAGNEDRGGRASVSLEGQWGPSVSLGANLWDFVCAVQRLARLPLGDQRAPFWDEVSDLLGTYANTLDARELAVVCNAYAAGAQERLAGPLRDSIARRAAELAPELSTRDMVMIVHALSRTGSRDSTEVGTAKGEVGTWAAEIDPGVVHELAWATKALRFEETRPQQAALLVNSFARLRRLSDAGLFGKFFSFARKTLPVWDSHALTLFCNGFAKTNPKGRRYTTDEGWREIAGRCAAVLRGADGQALACMSHAFARMSTSPHAVAEFYDTVEEILVVRPRMNNLLGAQDLSLIAYGLAEHRRTRSAMIGNDISGDVPCIERDGVTADGQLDGAPAMGARSAWPLEEYASRQIRYFSALQIVYLLEAYVVLGRGHQSHFQSLLLQLQRVRHGLMGSTLSFACRAVSRARSSAGLSAVNNCLMELKRDFVRLGPSAFKMSHILMIAQAYADVAEACVVADKMQWPWLLHDELRPFLKELYFVAHRCAVHDARKAGLLSDWDHEMSWAGSDVSAGGSDQTNTKTSTVATPRAALMSGHQGEQAPALAADAAHSGALGNGDGVGGVAADDMILHEKLRGVREQIARISSAARLPDEQTQICVAEASAEK
eukprot:TRINITY_DN22364_c0_g1_i1.p1 TRINITY_DN22364_c0_g1~~TRINITY_DN22364_c0_g1_i1.p1  ORF type:complete len:661 (-),score=72.42 TRINITY_DN22364_c0_g1_i1:129-2111(-)